MEIKCQSGCHMCELAMISATDPTLSCMSSSTTLTSAKVGEKGTLFALEEPNQGCPVVGALETEAPEICVDVLWQSKIR